jgi:hypothetical protein
VRDAQISRVPKCRRPEVPKCRYSSGSSDSKGRVAPDLRNHDFMTRGFSMEHSVDSRNVKSRSAWSWAHDHNPWSYGSRAIKKGKRLLSNGWLRFLSKHPGRQIQSKSDRRSGWAISSSASGYLESSGVKIPEMQNPEISQRSPRS